MTTYYLIVFAVGLALGYWWGRRRALIAPKRQKVLDLFTVDRLEITNDDVQKALGISDATATRYLDELEKIGVIRQIGKTGAGVVYRRK